MLLNIVHNSVIFSASCKEDYTKLIFNLYNATSVGQLLSIFRMPRKNLKK